MLGPAYPNLSIVCCSWLCFQLWLIVMLMESKWRVMIITEFCSLLSSLTSTLRSGDINAAAAFPILRSSSKYFWSWSWKYLKVQVKNIYEFCFWEPFAGYKERPWPCSASHSAWCSYFIHTPLWSRSLIVPQLKCGSASLPPSSEWWSTQL